MKLKTEKWGTMKDEEILIDFTKQVYNNGFNAGAITCLAGWVSGYVVTTVVVENWDKITAIGPKIKSKLTKKEGS